jgi:hypothetical protein
MDIFSRFLRLFDVLRGSSSATENKWGGAEEKC